ncbi:MAG: hypothetical protein AAGI11_17620 [Pseudomonadota bacterium]
MKLALNIALGILIASAVLWSVRLGVLWWVGNQLQETLVEQQAQQEGRIQEIASARQAEAARVKAEEEREAERIRQQAAREEAKRRRKEQEFLAKRSAEAARQKQLRDIELAFENGYEPPPECAPSNTDANWVTCVDIKRRAKQAYISQQLMLSRAHEDIPTR